MVVAVNKMDLVTYSQDIFELIRANYMAFADQLEFSEVTTIPVSALKGDNIVARSNAMQWYQGPTLLGFLETVNIHESRVIQPLRFPVQWVNRPHPDFRGFSGTVEAGIATVGQNIQVLPSGTTAKIKNIVFFEDNLQSVEAGQAVPLTLDQEIDVSRGDVIVSADSPCEVSNQFQLNIVWMDQTPGYIGRSMWIKLGTIQVNSHITAIKHKN